MTELDRLDRAEAQSSLVVWHAALAEGFDVRIMNDGDFCAAASAEIHGPAFNLASGVAQLPHFVQMATDFFDEHLCRGWLITEDAPWPDARVEVTVDVFATAPSEISDAEIPAGLTIRPITPHDAERVVAIHAQTGSVGVPDDQREPWTAVYRRLAKHPLRTVLIAELNGGPVAAASVHIAGKTGWMRGASVIPSARGKGIQRALISARARIASDRGCDVVGAWAKPDSQSARNAERMGMVRLGTRRLYSYVPAQVNVPVPAPAVSR